MKTESNSAYIKKKIEEGENLHLDFKYAVNDSKKIARTLSAFANTDGGSILIGVKDNGKIAGVKSEEEYFMIESASVIHTKPEVPFKIHEHSLEGKQILEVKIEKSLLRPHLAPDEKGNMKAYFRWEDKNFKASIIMIRVWKKERSGMGVKLSYNNAEKFLLTYLNEYRYISFSKFKKTARISRYYAEKIMTDFILLKIIEPVIYNQQIFYGLVQNKL